jgi:O-antigen/teichoic acid export membrane protein
MFKRLMGNASTNLLQLFVNMSVTFVMAPIYLRLMGHYDYGLREIVLAFLGTMGLLSIGMQPTVSRFVSMHSARGERGDLDTVYVSSMVFMFCIGLLLGIGFWIWAFLYPDALGQDGSSSSKYMFFLLLVGLQAWLSFPMNVVISILEGLQRFVFKNLLNITTTVSIAVISYHYMDENNALLLLVSLTLASVLLRFLLFVWILSLPKLGSLSLQISAFSWIKLKEMLGFGSKSFVQYISTSMNQASDKLVIGGVLGASALPVFTIPNTLMTYVNNITMTFTQVFMPMFSHMNALNQKDQLKEIFLFASKYTVAAVLAMSVGIGVIGGPFIGVWMPGEFDPDLVNKIVLVLASYIAIHRLNPFAGHFLTAINRHGFLAKVMPIGALANLLVSLWLVFEIGVLGAAIGTLVPVFVIVPLVLGYCCRQLEISVLFYIRTSILPGLVPVMIMGAVIVVMRLELGLKSYSDIILVVLTGGSVFALAFLSFSCPKNERDFWLRKLRLFRKAR